MSLLSHFLILALLGPSGSLPRHPDTVEVFACDFGQAWDLNYDRWPDRWQRVFGEGLPKYVEAGIVADEAAPNGSRLTVKVNGGGAKLLSPCASVSEKFSYKVESLLDVRGLQHARVRLQVEFCDEQKQVIETVDSPWRQNTGGWVDCHIGPISPTDPRVQLARVAFIVEPGELTDLAGEASLARVWLGRLPRMTIESNSAYNVYTNPSDVEVKCDLSGILDSDPDILFELLDASMQRLDGRRVQFEGRVITERRSKASEIVEPDPDQNVAYAGSTTWRPVIRQHGFYKVRVTMETEQGMLKRDVINLIVAPPLARPSEGEFGWSLAGDEIPLSLDNLAKLLPQAAINWVKLPVWYDPAEPRRGDDLVVLTEKLAAADIETVGVIDHPPASAEFARRLSPDAAIADVFAVDSSAWLPLLDPVLTRLSMRVRWWQLGADDDASLAADENLQAKVLDLREKLFRFGQEVNLGIGWDWTQEALAGVSLPWNFEQMSAAPALTGPEIAAYLDLPNPAGTRRWVLIEPLPRGEYDLESRTRDMVEQMLAAKIKAADAIFVARPFDDERGLMNNAGSPSDLFLPWRTAASLLGGAKFVGSIDLPGDSQNRVFETKQGEFLMVVWSDEPCEEIAYLGDDVRVVDVWGREELADASGDGQLVKVDRLPRFVLGLNPYVARWRMETRFAAKHVPSIFGAAHNNKLQLHNSFPQGVSGMVEIVGPEGWQITPARSDFKLAAGESFAKPIQVTLPFDATGGTSPVRIDFVVDGERQYRFSVYRNLIVGDGQLELDTYTRLEEDGTLVVEQRMVNFNSDPLDFKCQLYAPGRRRQRAQVTRLGPSPDVKVYRYPNGAELIGAEFWLRAQEIDGGRVLNHRFTVEQ
ncbi:COG1470 family protein [Lacipirellula limnantheis]|uniref:Uncharacterized protein n=1 Tax=Lacipirellula limnantheis TaxID=2528024 RepID=A0A517TUE5_9BACT|nr:hypothetical protein [Lacipirellula limnantheis]QDT71985.1 hypothetical protein I41_11500 [Lacipirellula limnantheis]